MNHFRGVLDDEEGEWDRVLLELIWVWVLDDGESLTVRRVLDDREVKRGRRRGTGEIKN